MEEVMRALERAGRAQTAKIYLRHGASEPLFGVSFAELGKLRKRYAPDHELARALWASGNFDARLLALMVADPEALRQREAEAWLREIDAYMLSNHLGSLVARTPFAARALAKWCRSRREYVRHCGYDVLATLLKNGHVFSRGELAGWLATIEAEIHGSPDRARNAMNVALIAIGTYGPGLAQAAIRAARRIGPVEVDHGETGCKTLDAVPYIEKARAHRKKMEARREAKKTSGRRQS